MKSNVMVFSRRQLLNAVGAAAAVATLPSRAFAGKNMAKDVTRRAHRQRSRLKCLSLAQRAVTE